MCRVTMLATASALSIGIVGGGIGGLTVGIGARMVGHAMYAGKRVGAKYAVITMCVGGGQGAAGLFEIF